MVPFALFVVVTVSQASVRCDETRRVVPRQVKAAVASLRKDLAKRGMRPTDLPEEAASAFRLLEAQMRTHGWCGADEQVRVVRESLKRSAPAAKRSSAKASAPAPAFAPNEDLPEKEVAGGCPSFAKGRPLSVAQALEQLATTLERSQVRTIDIRRGPNLEESLQQAVRLKDNPRVVKTSCVLTYRASLVTDGLDRAMARFQRVNQLRDAHGVSEGEKPRFNDLVNQASSQVATRDYASARSTLETLLVLMGDPDRPSGSLPRL